MEKVNSSILNLPQEEVSLGSGIDHLVGKAISAKRQEKKWTIKILSSQSGISPAMISKIENGLVSPSLSTLNALANALNEPLMRFFQQTVDTADITYVKSGEQITSMRNLGSHKHYFKLLGYHKRSDIVFEPCLITLKKQEKDEFPRYSDSGCVFIYMLEGKMIYQCNDEQFKMGRDDSLSFDAAVNYGIVDILTQGVKFLTVQSKKLD